MKPILTFKMGSSYFFKDFEDYKQKDCDELCIMDRFPFPNTNVLNMKKNEKDVFFFRNMDKNGFIKDTIDSKVPMRIGKFLIPEFCKYIKFEISDYDKLNSVIEKLDDKHKYEKLIIDFYKENNDFTLTDEQLKTVYEEYKKERMA